MPAIRIEQNIFVVGVETCAVVVAVEQESFQSGREFFIGLANRQNVLHVKKFGNVLRNSHGI